MNAVIYIDNDGNIQCLANDLVDKLNTLGDKQVSRVSNIEFDHTQQLWVATDMSGVTIATSPIRGKVIEEEQRYLNSKIESVFACAASN
jgi:hypothetical protein